MPELPVAPLAGEDVHVWRVELDWPPEEVARLARLLSPDEQARAARYLVEPPRVQFTVARGWLRTLLGKYLEVEPTELQFSYGEHEKPALARPAGTGLRFNIAHSHKLALMAFTRIKELGVDVEHMRPLDHLEGMVQRVMSPREQAVFWSLPPAQYQQAFFNLWARKEAYIKATGRGLFENLHQIEVSLAPGEPARLLTIGGLSADHSRWSLRALEPDRAYTAALVVEGRDYHVTQLSLTAP